MVRLEKQLAIIQLSWKHHDEATPRAVGVFSLNLQHLLDDGYVRRDGEGVRLRFARKDDGVIYVQSRNGGPAVAVGEVGF
jgi:hypothetical protein